MELIYTDAQWHDLAVVAGCELDCEFGPGSRNSWQLECPADDAPAMSDGSLLYCDGGEVGGVVDGIAPDTGEGTVTFSGRTWHGVLDGNLIAPAAGQDYKTVDGEANAAIGSLIGEMGISDLFAADAADSGVRVSHQFGRPAATGYQGLVDMLAGSGAKLRTRFDSASRKCVLSAAPKGDYSTEELDGDRISVKIERDWRPVNHLACFGSGELKDRIRLDLYADESGNVSKTQSIFGAKHRGAVYDYSSADAETLEKDGRKKLEELQAADEIQVTLPDDSEYEIGDVVGGREPVTGIYTTATLTRKTVLIDGDGEMDVRYEAGGTASGVSLSNASGGGNGGNAYLAGKGLTLEGYTFNADVDAESLAAVEAKADGAATAASNASAAAGKAETVAKAATVAAAENAKAIAGKQDALTAGANVTISGSIINAKDTTYDEATTAKAGLMSAADKGRLDGIANVKDWVVSRAENLVSNGYATLGDNTNFSGFAFDGADAFQSGGSFSKKSTSPSTAFTDELMPYDPSSAYRLSYYIKSDSASAKYYDILDCYDIDGLQITDGHVIFTPGSTTRLAADLKPGDSSVSVESAAGFNASDTDGRQYFNRGLMFWDYANSYGYVYAPETYTRNRYERLWTSNASAIDKAGNRIMLDRAWSGPAVPRGTSVSQTENGSTFVYGNVHFTVPAGEWTRKECAFENMARAGTAYVKIGWLIPNVMGGASSVTTKLTGVSFGAVPAHSKTASSASSADNAATADRLKEARTVSISGAVNGSATWDGSGDLSIVVAGDSVAAGFLAAHPVGTYMETSGYDPSDYGGEWSMVPSIGPYTWLRTK